jgi:hypothetical protein
MLKFSGYSYLIRGQPLRSWGFYGVALPLSSCEVSYYCAEEVAGGTATRFRGQPPALGASG